MKIHLLLLTSFTVLSLLTFPALSEIVPILDDFDDGNDEGWTRNDTLGDKGLVDPADYTFPDGKYRISGPGGNIQWARPMAYRTDSNLTDFHIEVDVTDYSDVSQNIGVHARHSKPGFGGNLGYFLNYNPSSDSFQLWRSTADHPSGIARLKTASVDLGESRGFRLVFTGVGDALTGEIFPLDEPNNSLATLEAKDTTFDSGLVGVATIATGGGIRTDATFDNFKAYDPKCPPVEAQPLLNLNVKEIQRVDNQVSMTVDGIVGDERLVVLRSEDLKIWHVTDHSIKANVIELGDLSVISNHYRVGRSLAGAKLALTVKGRTMPSDEEACQEILKHIPQALTEGTAARIYIKDTGEGDHFGKYTSEFALDLFYAEVPGFEEPIAVAATGWIVQTHEDGTQVFWKTASAFQLDASAKVHSELLWGTGRFEGVTGEVTGISVPEDHENPTKSPFKYQDTGWIRLSAP